MSSLNFYFKIFFEALIQNLPTQNSEDFLFQIGLFSLQQDKNVFFVTTAHLSGFYFAIFFSFLSGFLLGYFSIKKFPLTPKNLSMANFLYRFGWIIIFFIIYFFNYGYFGGVFFIFLGYSFAILKKFQLQKSDAFFKISFLVFTSFCAKLLYIYLIYNKIHSSN